jgi:O-methyltransferase
MTRDLNTQREVRAMGPGPEAETMRLAYLDLLKLTLCDLAGAGSLTVEFLKDSRVYSRELAPEHPEPRIEGRDWPWSGLTMAGLERLDDLQHCVESVVSEDVPGDLIEAGTWRGGASILMRATLDSLGDADRTVWVADSFQGFPGREDGGAEADLGPGEMTMLEFLSISVDEVRGNFERFGLGDRVKFVPGFFAETMPGLAGRRWSVVRLDGDSYDATRACLEVLYPGLSKGGYLVVDDYGAIDGCRQAVDEYRAEEGIEEPLEQVDWTCARWRRESDAGPATAPGDARAENPEQVQPAAQRRPGSRVPSIRELQLRKEIAELREHESKPAPKRWRVGRK